MSCSKDHVQVVLSSPGLFSCHANRHLMVIHVVLSLALALLDVIQRSVSFGHSLDLQRKCLLSSLALQVHWQCCTTP